MDPVLGKTGFSLLHCNQHNLKLCDEVGKEEASDLYKPNQLNTLDKVASPSTCTTRVAQRHSLWGCFDGVKEEYEE